MLTRSNPASSKGRSLEHIVVFIFLLNVTALGIPDTKLSDENSGASVLDKYNCRIRGSLRPYQDTYLEVGNALNLTCILNKQCEFTSADLYFAIPTPSPLYNDSLTEYTTMLDDRSIQLYIPDMTNISTQMYYCMAGTNIIGGHYVTVGSAPLEPQDVGCTSYNADSLSCSWYQPVNGVNTCYSVYTTYCYLNASNELDCKEYLASKNCNPNTTMTATWSGNTYPAYVCPTEEWNLVIEATNQFQEEPQRWNYVFDIYNHTKTAPPIKFQGVNASDADGDLSSSTILFQWQPDPTLYCLIAVGQFDFDYLLAYTPHSPSCNIPNTKHHHEIQTKFANTTDLNPSKKIQQLQVNDLQPYTMYNASLRMKMKDAPRSLWSEPAETSFITKSDIPAAPPKTDKGSFQLIPGSSQTIIYWQHIPCWKRNGPKFHYNLSSSLREHNGTIISGRMHDKRSTYNSYFETNDSNAVSYVVYITSVNEIGPSLTMSSIIIPSTTALAPSPHIVTRINYENSTELFWTIKPSDHWRIYEIEDYTLFWCVGGLDSSNRCPGIMNWRHFNSTSEMSYFVDWGFENVEYAISANSNFSSSGLVWVSCTMKENGPSSASFKNFNANPVGYQSILLDWDLDCGDAIDIVRGYQVQYSEKGTDGFVTKNITGFQQTKYLLTGLKSCTIYNVQVSAIMDSNAPQTSVTKKPKTYSSAPPNIMIKSGNFSNVTNSSFVYTWTVDPKLNNIASHYILYYGSQSISVPVDENPDTAIYEQVVTGLPCYKSYTVYVDACTCSDGTSCTSGSKVTVTTDVEAPSQMDPANVKSMENSTTISVSWSEPKPPNGPIDFYLLTYFNDDLSEKISGSIFKINGSDSSTTVNLPSCDGHGVMKYGVSLEAVNENREGDWLRSPWSVAEYVNICNANANAPDLLGLWVGIGICSVVICVFIGFFIFKFWRRCDSLRKVRVVLPPGLAAPDFRKSSFVGKRRQSTPQTPRADSLSGFNFTTRTSIDSDTFSLGFRDDNLYLTNPVLSNIEEDGKFSPMSTDTGYSSVGLRNTPLTNESSKSAFTFDKLVEEDEQASPAETDPERIPDNLSAPTVSPYLQLSVLFPPMKNDKNIEKEEMEQNSLPQELTTSSSSEGITPYVRCGGMEPYTVPIVPGNKSEEINFGNYVKMAEQTVDVKNNILKDKEMFRQPSDDSTGYVRAGIAFTNDYVPSSVI